MACTTLIGKSVPTGDLVGTTDTQTLTNKTIDITGTGGNTITGDTWSILYTDGSGTFTELALGTSGQVLQSNGAAAAPSFENAAGGGNVSNTGTPVDSQIAVWTSATVVEGDPSFTWDTSTNYLSLNTDGDTGSTIYMGVDDYIANNLVSMSHVLGGTTALYLATVGTGRNVAIGEASGEFGGTTPGSGVLKLPDVTTTPAGTLTSGGGMLYVSGTSLYFHDDAGTATDLTASGSGNVSNTGTPVNNQVAVWTNSTTIEGTADLTYTVGVPNDPTLSLGVNTDGTSRFYMGANDQMIVNGSRWDTFVNNLGGLSVTSTQNVEVGGTGGSFGSTGAGTKVLRLNDVGTTPSGTLTSGGLLYVSGTDLYFHDDAGGVNPLIDFDVNTDVNTSWTLALEDRGDYIRANNASAITITVPPNSSVAFPIGTSILIEQMGAGAVTMSAGGGVTLNGSLSTSSQYQVLQLVKVGTDVWTVIGGG